MPAIPEGVGIWWPASHSSIPSGWTRNTNFDTRFIKSQSGSTNPNSNGGSGTHNHGAGGNHTHTVSGHTHTGNTNANTQSSGIVGEWTTYFSAASHTHAFTLPSQTGNLGAGAGSWQTGTYEPESHLAIYIESDGTGDGFPAGCVVYWNTSSAPSGWSQHSGTTGRLIRGAAGSSGNGGSDAGNANHTHTANAHNHTQASHEHGTGTTGNASNTFHGVSPYGYVHCSPPSGHTFDPPNAITDSGVQSVAGGSSGNANNTEPAWYRLGNITNSSAGWLENAICMWRGTLGNIPDDWVHMNTASGSGESATIDLRGKFIKSANSSLGGIGDTGGSAGHSHSAPSGHDHDSPHVHAGVTFGAASGLQHPHNWYAYAASSGHTHPNADSDSATPNSSSDAEPAPGNTADTEPVFRTVAFIRSPEEPASGGWAMLGANF